MSDESNLGNRQIFKVFWQHASEDRRTYYQSFALMFVTLLLELSRPFILKYALDYIKLGAFESLRMVALVFLGVLVFEYLARSGFNYLLSLAFLRTVSRIRERVFQHVLRLKIAFFDTEPVGRLLTRTINDAESLSETLRAGIATIFVDVFTVLGLFFVMVKLEISLSPVILLAAPIVGVTVRWCSQRLRRQYLSVRKELAEANGFMEEGISGVEIVQLFKQENQSFNQFETVNNKYCKATIWSNVYDATLYAVIDALAAIVTASILFVAFDVRFGLIEISVLIVYVDLVERLFVPIRDLSGKFATIQQAMAALQRIFNLLLMPYSIPHGEKKLTSDRLDIAFDDVRFRYKADGPLVLNGVSFTVRPGQVVALVGQTGSGKSTIGKLLTRAYDGYDGRILVGDVELKDLNNFSLRNHIAVVHQDVELFPGSIRDNIRMFDPSIADEKILWAVRQVKAEHMLEDLPGGLDFTIQTGGGNLSAGQMQLIVFARALAHDAPIILMDEATSSVDSLTESWIQEAMLQLFKHKTVVVVAHRLSTIAAADQILVLKHGEIIERGAHDSLMADEQGYYSSLVKASSHAADAREVLFF